jgi:NTP pyrophosphatase (non-canonical NTP hydrolase)|tara:strand:+ start:9021 stop:9479 length:459 start_codon:yes stop_codon:yes gene_type:complete
MLLNIFAEPVSKVLTQRLKTLKKLSTTLKMNSYIHRSLMTMAEQFRSAYMLMTGVSERGIQKALIDEEWSEFHEAYHLKDDCEQLKELADLVYVCYQFAASQEWDLDEAFRRVHESNMSKLDDNGKPIYRADGKVLKGPNYKEPHLLDLIIE